MSASQPQLPRELPRLILKVERPDRGPRTINVSLSITADEARRVVDGDRELTAEILDAVVTLILGAHRLAGSAMFGLTEEEPGK